MEMKTHAKRQQATAHLRTEEFCKFAALVKLCTPGNPLGTGFLVGFLICGLPDHSEIKKIQYF